MIELKLLHSFLFLSFPFPFHFIFCVYCCMAGALYDVHKTGQPCDESRKRISDREIHVCRFIDQSNKKKKKTNKK